MYNIYLTVGVKSSTTTTSKSAVVLISTLVPGFFLLCGLVTAFIVTVVKLKKKIVKLSAKATEHNEEVVEYASTFITPMNRLTNTPSSLQKSPPPSVELSQNTAYGWSQFSAVTTSRNEDARMGSVHSKNVPDCNSY